MRSQDVLAQLREDIANTKAEGHNTIEPDLLLKRLDVLQGWIEEDEQQDAKFRDVTQRLDQQSVDLGRDISRQKHEWDLEMFRSVITHGQSALKGALLITGGGAAALLAFLGSLVNTQSSYIPAVAAAIMYMVWAVVAAAISVGGTYLSQWCFGHDHESRWHKVGSGVQIFVILCFAIAIGLFAKGAWVAHKPFVTAQTQVAVPAPIAAPASEKMGN